MPSVVLLVTRWLSNVVELEVGLKNMFSYPSKWQYLSETYTHFGTECNTFFASVVYRLATPQLGQADEKPKHNTQTDFGLR